MAASGKSGNVIAKYLPVYFVLLAIAAIEFFLAYQNFSTAGLGRILLFLAICSPALGLMYFMHPAQEERRFFLSLDPATTFLLLMLIINSSATIPPLAMRPLPHLSAA